MLYRYRFLFIIAMLATASAAAASWRWQTWTPVTACLLCESHGSDDAAATSPAGSTPASGAPGTLALHNSSSTGSTGAGALITVPPGAEPATSGVPLARLGSAPHGWQPWGQRSGSFRVSSSSPAGPSASLGGLWRLVNSSGPGDGGGSPIGSAHVATATHTALPAASNPGTPKALPTMSAPGTHRPAPAPSLSSGGGSFASAPSARSGAAADDPAPPSGSAPPSGGSGGAPPTDPFHDHEDPPPGPLDPPAGGGGGFDPGGSGGGGGAAGGGVSPTPEPGSFFLIGTGLVGILGVLRRRRLI